MKAKVIVIVVVAVLVTLTLSAWTSSQEEDQEVGSISVTGDAEIRVVPDEVILTLGIQTWDKDMAKAKRQNDEIVARVLALTNDYGIEPQHVQTDYVSIDPRYRNGYYEESDFIGYFVRKTIVITLRDLTQFEDLLTDSLDAGVNFVHGIEFRTTELRKHRDEARSLAIQAAREKAGDMAADLGYTVGDPQSVAEVYSNWWSGYNSWWGSGMSGAMAQNVIQEVAGAIHTGDGNVAPGLISVNARVDVSFDLVK